MKCPYCFAEMERGAIQSSTSVYYTTESRKKKRMGRRVPDIGDVALISSMDTWGDYGAWHCPACHRIILEYTPEQLVEW